MDSCKPLNLTISDYTFYRNNISNSFTVVYQNKYGWNFSFKDSSIHVLENAETIGWLLDEHLTTRTHLPNFVNDYPEFFL